MPIDIVHGTGYRIGTSDRVVGGPTGAPNDFTVLNQTNGNVFIAQNGVWTLSGSPFPSDKLDEWYLS